LSLLKEGNLYGDKGIVKIFYGTVKSPETIFLYLYLRTLSGTYLDLSGDIHDKFCQGENGDFP
jgi:hypothetical protein